MHNGSLRVSPLRRVPFGKRRSAYKVVFDLLLILILIFKPLREAERRFCVVVLPAWMPGEPCWAMDGPSRRGHGAGPERGNLSAAKAVRWGKAFLVLFVVVRHSAV